MRIHGLKARPDLNGKCGRVERYDAGRQRYEVLVDGERESIMVKPTNLQPVNANADGEGGIRKKESMISIAI